MTIDSLSSKEKLRKENGSQYSDLVPTPLNDIDMLYMNFCRHTGSALIFLQEAILEESKTQKLNATRKGVCEIIGVSDYLPKIIFHSENFS